MAEFEGGIEMGLIGPDGSGAFIKPTEIIVDSKGKKMLGLDVMSTDQEAENAAREFLNQNFGPEAREEDVPKSARSSSFGFDSRRWKSGWQPKGPGKKPYKQGPPENLSSN